MSDFSVSITGEEVVAAALPLQEHWLPLSNLDLLLPPLDFSIFFCYHRNHNMNLSFTSMVNILKKAMAQALVQFYALGGEVVPNSLGEPEILCNNRGVDFIQAYADIELNHLQLYNPDATVEGKLVPKKKDGVLAVQATELRCGGLVVGITFDHRIADAHSANMFLTAWAEFAQEKQLLSHYPSFRRSLLNPRRPPPPHAAEAAHLIDKMYVPMSMSPPPPDANSNSHDHHHDDHNVTISRIYYIAAEHIHQLQQEAMAMSTSDSSSTSFQVQTPPRISKLASFCAFLWQMVAKGADDEAKSCKMGIVVDGRTRMMSSSRSGEDLGGDHRIADNDDHNNTKKISKMMSSYFGNVLSIPFGEVSMEELKSKPLSWVAGVVLDFVEAAACREHFLGLIDWVEAHRPEPFITRVYCTQSNAEVALVVSSGLRFPVSKVNFGWGKPAFGSYHFPWGGRAGYVMPMPSPKGNGDWVVYVHLLKPHLDWLETEVSHIFRPLTSEYLNNI